MNPQYILFTFHLFIKHYITIILEFKLVYINLNAQKQIGSTDAICTNFSWLSDSLCICLYRRAIRMVIYLPVSY